MKLEIKHLAAYLPYNVRLTDLSNAVHELDVENIAGVLNEAENLNTIRLLLRPLSDFSEKEWMDIFLSCCHKNVIRLWESREVDLKIHIKGGVIRLYDASKGMSIIIPKVTLLSYSIESKGIVNTNAYLFDCERFFREIYKLHGDLNNLIDQGLAININTLNQKK